VASVAAVSALLGAEASSKEAPGRRQEFLQMFARSYYPGRSGQVMLVPREGVILTRSDPAYRFMHGSPWDYDTRIPLILYGGPFVRRGAYAEAARHQDVAPTIAELLALPLPATTTGRALKRAIDPSAGRPRAVLLAVLDAFRADYLDRHASALPNLTRLRQQGAHFTRARVDYVPTATAVAHATIATGTDPAVHGISVNSMYDHARQQAQDPYPGKSPRNLMAPTLAELWSLETDGRAVIAALGGLFYAPAGLAGHGGCALNGRPVILAAYDRGSGGWESNPECYRLPEYLKGSNVRTVWEETGGRWLGHDIANPEAVRRSSPFARFDAGALIAVIENEPVGADDVTDLLLANLKTTDFVGHAYGPDSPEIADALAESDRQLGRVLDALERKVGRERTLVVVSADHGMPPEGVRHNSDDILKQLHEKLDPAAKLIRHYETSNGQLFVDRSRARELGIGLDAVKRAVEALPFIYAAYTEDEVRRARLAPVPTSR
jgi:hypothetical protein